MLEPDLAESLEAEGHRLQPGHPARLRSGIAYHRPMSSQAASPSQARSELLAMGLTAAVVLLADQATKAAIASALDAGRRGWR